MKYFAIVAAALAFAAASTQPAAAKRGEDFRAVPAGTPAKNVPLNPGRKVGAGLAGGQSHHTSAHHPSSHHGRPRTR